MLTICPKNLSFRYKSSKATKKVPLFRVRSEEGTHAWFWIIYGCSVKPKTR